jgi:hypothetical protein
MISNLNSFSPKQIVLETFDMFSSLSNTHKALSLALTILGTFCFIIPGIILFRLSIVKFREWEDESHAKQTANKIQAIVNLPTLNPQNSISDTTHIDIKKSYTHQKTALKNLIYPQLSSFMSNIHYLATYGKPGDYILYKDSHNTSVTSITYMKENKQLDGFDVLEGNENFYDLAPYDKTSLNKLNNLKNPINSNLSKEKGAKIQGALTDYKYLRLIQSLALAVKNEAFSREFLGVDAPFDLYGLLDWIKECENVSIRDQLVSAVYPFFSKAYGHIFGLSGEIEMEGKKIEIEGMFSCHAVSLLGFCQIEHLQKTELLSKEEKKYFADFINCNCSYFSGGIISPENEIHADILSDKIVSISSGWKGHAINITLSKEILAVTNRGDRKKGIAPGTNIYTIKDVNQFTPEKILLYFGQSHDKEDHVSNQLENDCKSGLLKFLHFHPSGEQRVGNCGFINNAKNSFLTAFIYTYRKNQQIEKSISFAEIFYREMRVQSKTIMLDLWKRLQLLMPKQKKKEHFDIFRSFNRLVFEKYTKKRQSSLLGINSKIKDPTEYEALYEHAHEMMSECSVPLEEVLRIESFSNCQVPGNFLINCPPGTFGFFYYPENTYDYQIVTGLKPDDFFSEVKCQIRKNKSKNSFHVCIDVSVKGETFSAAHIVDLCTVGEVINEIKKASMEAISNSKLPDPGYKGLELRFVV